MKTKLMTASVLWLAVFVVIAFHPNKAHASAPKIAPEHAHVVLTMQCQWTDEDGKPNSNEAQTFTLFEDWNKTQWVEVAAAHDAPKGFKVAPYIRLV